MVVRGMSGVQHQAEHSDRRGDCAENHQDGDGRHEAEGRAAVAVHKNTPIVAVVGV